MKATTFLAFLFFSAGINAQNAPVTPLSNKPVEEADTTEPKKGFDPNRLVIGGSLGASFGDYTFVNLSPQVGYMFNQYITAGAGINYVFQSVKTYQAGTSNYIYKENYSYVGMNLFARVFPIRFLFISAQPELNYGWGKVKFNDEYFQDPDIKQDGKFIPSFLVGAGAVLSPNGKGGMFISLQYDLIQDDRSPYGTKPYLSIGFGF
jgi:hypothetical protein